MTDFVFLGFRHFGVRLCPADGLEDRIPAEISRSSRIHNLPFRPSHKDVWLRIHASSHITILTSEKT